MRCVLGANRFLITTSPLLFCPISRFATHLVLIFFQRPQIKRYSLSQPYCPLRMRPQSISVISIGMNKRRQRPSIDDQPRYEGPKLCGCENIDLKHCHGMRSNSTIPDPINSERYQVSSKIQDSVLMVNLRPICTSTQGTLVEFSPTALWRTQSALDY